jgi:hypothetical protein
VAAAPHRSRHTPIAVQLAFSAFLLGVVDLPLHGKRSDAA